MQRTLVLVGLVALVSITLSLAPANRKKLIEFGWDIPDPAFMRRHAAQMERTPFDGCVFQITYQRPDGKKGNFTWECWGRKAFAWSELQPAVSDLQAAPLRRLSHNFLRFNVTPGDVDWFDDFSAILNNARLAARIVHTCHDKVKGILFDIEQYQAPLFDYQKQARAKEKSWDEYAAQARQRGREVMNAFQQECPEIVIFLTFGFSLPYRQSGGGKKPLSEVSYGLLAPFLNGMLEAAQETVRFVDGYEFAYPFRERKQFEEGYRIMSEEVLPLVSDRKKYRRLFSFGFGVWMDCYWRRQGWHLEDFSKNWFTPEQYEQALRHALEVADEYVWVRTEQPRWWTERGEPERLPKAYWQAVVNARKAVIGD